MINMITFGPQTTKPIIIWTLIELERFRPSCSGPHSRAAGELWSRSWEQAVDEALDVGRVNIPVSVHVAGHGSHGVARFLGDKELARRTGRLIAFAVGMGVMVLIVIPSMSRPDENYYRGILVLAVDGVAAAIGLVWCLRLIGSTRKAILDGPKSEAETTAEDGV